MHRTQSTIAIDRMSRFAATGIGYFLRDNQATAQRAEYDEA
jgi:hypothetical protein